MTIKELLATNANETTDYQFSQYIFEIAAILKNDTATLVLCNLLNKLCNYSDLSIKTISASKQYHFFHSQEDIYSHELYIDKQKYNRALKRLIEKNLVTTFDGRNPSNKMFKITYFFMNLENIKETYKQGYMLMHKKPAENKPQKQTYPAKFEQKISIQQQTKLKEIEREYKSKFITQAIYEYKKNNILNTK